MRVMLIFPPCFDASMPNLSLPCLASVLRSAGHDVILKDVNVESYDHFFTENELRRVFELVREEYDYFAFSGTSLEEFERLVEKRNFLFKNVERAKMVLRNNEAFYDFKEYTDSIDILNDSLKLLSLAYYKTEITLNSFKTMYNYESTNQIMQAIEDENSNPYIDYYKRYVMTTILDASPNLIGISISASSQMIPGLTLAYMIKKVLKDVHIVVGGNHITSLKDNLIDNHTLFTLFDSVILHEGETALLQLADNIEQGKPLNSVPNLMYKNKNGIIKTTDYIHVENVDELPTPDFQGLPLELYLSPELLLPIYSSRGCYWGKCSFCNFHKTSGHNYRVRSIEKIIEDIKILSVKNSSNSFIFTDEALSPKYFGLLSDELIQKNISINWFSCARFEKQIDKILCEKLVKSGCKVLAFGLESACDRVLAKMKKGTDVKTIHNTLINSSMAGITNHTCFILGFPTETPDEAMETINFVLEHIEHIGSMNSANFSLLNNSHVFLNKDEFDIEIIPRKNEFDLAFTYDYNTKSGLSQKENQLANHKFTDEMLKLVYPFYAYADFFNFHIFLYAKKYNTNKLFEVFENFFKIDKKKAVSDIKQHMNETLKDLTVK